MDEKKDSRDEILIQIVEDFDEGQFYDSELESEEGVNKVEEVVTNAPETEVYGFLQDSEKRWEEIHLLIEKIQAEKEEADSNSKFYDVLCRSTAVLLVAQLEGYIKDLAKALVRDLSDNIDFSSMPKIIKKNFTNYFLGDSGGRYMDLSELFEKVNPNINVEAFLYDKNKNPAPSVIEKVLGNFGIESFFTDIHNSRLDIVFENNTKPTDDLVEELRNHLLEATKHFPYQVDLNKFELKTSQVKFTKKNRSESLWMHFLDEILTKRHKVAHGTNFNNELTDVLLKEYERKAKILQYAIALELIGAVSQDHGYVSK